jgi:hypothetical protein
MNLRCFNPQFFFASKVGDIAFDERAERGVSAYGDQLRVIVDAVRVLCAAIPPDDLLPADLLALDRLKVLGRPADSSVTPDAAGDASLTTADVDDLIVRLLRLRQEDPESADRIVRRVVEEAGPVGAENPPGQVTRPVGTRG